MGALCRLLVNDAILKPEPGYAILDAALNNFWYKLRCTKYIDKVDGKRNADQVWESELSKYFFYQWSDRYDTVTMCLHCACDTMTGASRIRRQADNGYGVDIMQSPTNFFRRWIEVQHKTTIPLFDNDDRIPGEDTSIVIIRLDPGCSWSGRLARSTKACRHKGLVG